MATVWIWHLADLAWLVAIQDSAESKLNELSWTALSQDARCLGLRMSQIYYLQFSHFCLQYTYNTQQRSLQRIRIRQYPHY